MSLKISDRNGGFKELPSKEISVFQCHAEGTWESIRGALPGFIQKYLVSQDYEEYTSVEHQIWETCLSRHSAFLQEYPTRIFTPYLEGFYQLALPKRRLPLLVELNERLAPTGWRTVIVSEDTPAFVHLELLARRIYPLSRRIRTIDENSHACTEDLIHDVLGHFPMLFSENLSKYFQTFSEIARFSKESALDTLMYEASSHLSKLMSGMNSSWEQIQRAERLVEQTKRLRETSSSNLLHLERIYHWTMESGLIGTPENFQILGANLLAGGERRLKLIEETSELKDYSLNVIHENKQACGVPKRLFVASSVQDFIKILEDYKTQFLF